MKKRVLSILLCVIMLCSLLPTATLAEGNTATLLYINVTEWTDGENPQPTGIELTEEPGESPMGVYISGSGSYAVTENFFDIVTVINNATVTIGEGGAVNTENVYIFGRGSLIVGEVVLTSDNAAIVDTGEDPASAVFAAVMTKDSDVVDISGTITAGTELVVRNAIVSDTLTFAGAGSQITIGGGGSLTVEAGATVTPAQDAKITALAGATISGITLYAANTTDALNENGSSYTVTTEGVDDQYAENFIWLENGEADENEEAPVIKKWVQMVDEGDPNVPGNNEYWFEYDGRGDATVMLGEDSIPIPSRWSKDYTDPIKFYPEDDTYAAISFTLAPPQDGGTYNAPIVEVEVFDWTEDKPYNTVEPLTATKTDDGTYACAYTPTSDSGFVVRVWWSAYEMFGPTEDLPYIVEFCWNGSGTAVVSVNKDDQITDGNRTKVRLSGTELPITLQPDDGQTIERIFVEQDGADVNLTEDGRFKDNTFTIDLSGDNYNEGSGKFVFISFEFTSGAGEEETKYSVDFGSGSWTVGEVTVKADKDGTQTLSETDIITLTGFDAKTMEVKLTAAGGFNTTLTVTNGETSLAANNCDGLPNAMTFAVVAKDSGVEDPGQTTSTAEIGFVPQQGVTLAVNDGIITFTDSESVPIGTVQVYMGDSTYAYTEFLPTELTEARLAIPEKTETVKIVLKPKGDLEAQLVYSGDIRKAGAISDPVINEGTYTYTITVAKIPENDSGSRFVGITVEFGTNLGGGEDFTAVIWNGDQVEQQSAHGTIGVASIEVGNNMYPYDSTTGKFIGVPEGLRLECYYDPPTGESGVRIGDTAFGESQKVEVYINFVFKPDYGYQVTGIGTNESQTSVFVPVDEEPSTFKFPVFYHNNPHFNVAFTEGDNVTDVTGTENVSAATIDDGGNDIAYSGNLKLSVADLSGDDLSAAQDAFADELESTDDADNIMYLDVDLFQIVSKGENNGYWETQLTDLGDNTVSITLNVGADPNATYYVIREHVGENNSVTYDPVEVENNGNGTITFTTNQFSTYAIGYTPGNDGDDTPTTPSIPTTPDTPTNEKVEIPVSGDDETIHVGATVSGDTVTVDEIDMGQLDGVIGSGVDTGTVTIDFSGLDSTASITTVELPANVVKEIAEAVNDPENDAESLEIVMTSGVSITFDADALREKVSQADGADITISIESHEDADLTDAQKDAVGSRPAFDINVTSGGEHISDIGGKITIGAPYELKPDEKESGLVVWYVDNKGNRERCQGSYDPINKRMNWETDHLSLYMIDYCPSATFADLDIDAWYTDSTDFVIANGLMNGIGDDKFDPNGTTSRAMIVTILWRLEGSPVVNSASVFNDVENGQWYSDAIAWANMNSIVEGYDGKFDPTGEITREQFATILWRYAKYKGYDVSVGEDTNILSYEDAFSISEYAIPAMQWACGAGLMQGDGVNLTPKADATRAQAAALFQRFCENVAEK